MKFVNLNTMQIVNVIFGALCLCKFIIAKPQRGSYWDLKLNWCDMRSGPSEISNFPLFISFLFTLLLTLAVYSCGKQSTRIPEQRDFKSVIMPPLLFFLFSWLIRQDFWEGTSFSKWLSRVQFEPRWFFRTGNDSSLAMNDSKIIF